MGDNGVAHPRLNPPDRKVSALLLLGRDVLDHLTIQYETSDIRAADIAEIIDALAAQDEIVRITCERVPGAPAASPLFADWSVVLLVLSIAGQGFLKKAGEDAYQGVRKALAATLRQAVGKKQARGGYVFTIRLNGPDRYVLFTYRDPPTEGELAVGFATACDALDGLPDSEIAQFVFNPEAGCWSEPIIPDAHISETLKRIYLKAK